MVWETAERKVVGGIEIGQPVAPTSVSPPAKMTFLERHKLVKKTLEKEAYNYRCIKPSEIAEVVGLSEDVVAEHIAVLIEDEAAVSVQKGENPVVCSVQGLDRLVQNLRKLRVSETK